MIYAPGQLLILTKNGNYVCHLYEISIAISNAEILHTQSDKNLGFIMDCCLKNH